MTKAAKRTIAILLLLAIGGGAAWYFLSPTWTLREMHKAAEAKDAEALAAYVDFPALRANLKEELEEQVADGTIGGGGIIGRAASALGGVLVAPLLDTLIDSLVTPSALRRMFASSEFVERDDPARPIPMPVKLGKDPVITRTDFSHFRVSPRGKPGGLIFCRDGLGWKLCGVDLPPAEPADGAPGRGETI